MRNSFSAKTGNEQMKPSLCLWIAVAVCAAAFAVARPRRRRWDAPEGGPLAAEAFCKGPCAPGGSNPRRLAAV